MMARAAFTSTGTIPGRWCRYSYTMIIPVAILMVVLSILLRQRSLDLASSTSNFDAKSLSLKKLLERWVWGQDAATASTGIYKYVCEQPRYTARIASYSPLIIHLEGFVTEFEREYLIGVG